MNEEIEEIESTQISEVKFWPMRFCYLNKTKAINAGIVLCREDGFIFKKSWIDEKSGDDGWVPVEDFSYSILAPMSEPAFPPSESDELFNLLVSIARD